MVRTFTFLAISLSCISFSLQAVITPIRTLDRFNRTVINEPLVVAYIYQSEPNCIDVDGCYDKAYRKERKEQIAKNSAVLKAVSRDGRYQAAGINFVTTNLSKDHACDLKRTYHLTDEDSLVLIEKEEPVATQLTGLLTRGSVERLIESSWGDKIDDILQQQAQERKQRLAEMKASAAYWGTGPYGPPFGYWGGYGGYGYGCPGNYVSFGLGFSC